MNTNIELLLIGFGSAVVAGIFFYTLSKIDFTEANRGKRLLYALSVLMTIWMGVVSLLTFLQLVVDIPWLSGWLDFTFDRGPWFLFLDVLFLIFGLGVWFCLALVGCLIGIILDAFIHEIRKMWFHRRAR
jgi:hypothetical protein